MSQQYQIIHIPTGEPVGEPGRAGDISDQCTDLNDRANPDPEQMRVIVYRIERFQQKGPAN